MNIQDYSIQQLKEALRIKEENESILISNLKILDLDKIDWSTVINMAKVSVNTRALDLYMDDDFQEYLEEEVLKTVYGKNIFDQIQKIKNGKKG